MRDAPFINGRDSTVRRCCMGTIDVRDRVNLHKDAHSSEPPPSSLDCEGSWRTPVNQRASERMETVGVGG